MPTNDDDAKPLPEKPDAEPMSDDEDELEDQGEAGESDGMVSRADTGEYSTGATPNGAPAIAPD